jgi:hypothetical protein
MRYKMEEATWYMKQRSQMGESLWTLEQRSRVLQDYRKDTQSVWQDDASSEINNRYLRPHEEDSGRCLTALGQQLSLLQQSDTELDLAKQHGLEISRLSEDLEKLLDFARQDISRSHSEYAGFQDQTSAAKAELPVIMNLINQANNCCR